jgi:hypothetical protein
MMKPIIECDNCYKQYAVGESCYEYTTVDTGETYTICVECDKLPEGPGVDRGESVLGIFAKKLAELVPSYTNT